MLVTPNDFDLGDKTNIYSTLTKLFYCLFSKTHYFLENLHSFNEPFFIFIMISGQLYHPLTSCPLKRSKLILINTLNTSSYKWSIQVAMYELHFYVFLNKLIVNELHVTDPFAYWMF